MMGVAGRPEGGRCQGAQVYFEDTSEAEGRARNVVYREVESRPQAHTVFLSAWLLRTGLLAATCGDRLLRVKKRRL